MCVLYVKVVCAYMAVCANNIRGYCEMLKNTLDRTAQAPTRPQDVVFRILVIVEAATVRQSLRFDA